MAEPPDLAELLSQRARDIEPVTDLERRTSQPAVPLPKPGTPILPESLEAIREIRIKSLDELQEELKTKQVILPEVASELAALPASRAGFQAFDPTFAAGQMFSSLIPSGDTTFEERVGERLGPPEETLRQQEVFDQLTLEILDLTDKIYWTRWQANILTALPVFVQADPNISAEEIFESTQYGSRAITPEAKRFIDGVLTTLRQDIEAKRVEGEAVLELLQQPGGSLRDLLALNVSNQSSEQIVQDIVAAGRFSLPDSLSPSQVRSMLSDMGMSDAEIDEQMFDASAEAFRLAEELRQWDEQNQRILLVGQQIRDGEITSRIRKSQWARAAIQPGLLLLRPVEFWQNTVPRPIGGALRGVFLRAKTVKFPRITVLKDREGDFNFIPSARIEWHGNSRELAEYNAVIEKAKAEGANSWEAYRFTFEEWDTNWFNKFALEVFADPLTYLGFGLYTKLASPLPKLGAGVGLFERGFTRAMELPFDAFKAMWNNAAPRTVNFAGQRQARATWDLLMHSFSEAHNRNRAISIRFGTPEELRDHAFLAINEVIDNPGGVDEVTRLGRALLGSKSISEAETRTLLTSLKATNEITPELLSRLNFANEITKQQHGISGFLTGDESASYIVTKVLGLTGTDDEIKIVKGFLNTVKSRLIREAQAPFQSGTTRQMSLAMMDHVRGTFVAAQQDVIANSRVQQGLVRQALYGLPNATAKAWMNTIDRFVTLPMAKAYLMFGMYGPMNILESAIKTMLATNSIRSAFFRGGGFREGQQTAIVLTGIEESVPINILFVADFNVGLALPDSQWRTLANPSSSPAERNIARRIVTKYTQAVNKGMLLKTLGEDIKTGTLYNWGNRISGAQLNHYQKVMYLRQLTEREPDLIEALGRVIKEETAGFEAHMTKEVAQSYREALFNASTTGDVRVLDSTPDVFTPNRVHAGEVARELDSFDLISPDMKQMVINATETGEIFRPGGVETFRSMLREASYERYFTSPETFESTYGDIIGAILETVPRSTTEINAKVNMLDSLIEVFENTVSNTLDSAKSYSRSLRDSRQSTEFFNSLWGDRLSPTISRIGIGIDNAIKGMREQLNLTRAFDDLQPGVRDQYNNLLDNILKRSEVYRQARLEYQSVRVDFFTQGGANFVKEGSRDNAFWNNFFAASTKPWDDARNLLTKLEPELLVAKSKLADTILPIAPDISGQGVRRIDIARLWGLPTGDLERSLFLVDSMSIWNRNDFIAKTLARAELSAKATQKTASQIGWNADVVGRLYDDMVVKFRANPKVATGVEPLMLQVDNALTKVSAVGMRRNALMSEEGHQLVRESVDRLSTRIYGRGEGTISGPLESLDFELVARSASPATRGQPLAIAEERALVPRQQERLDDVTTAVRTHAESQQELINKFKLDVRDAKSRRAFRFSNRLVKLKEAGVDVNVVDLELENFITAMTSGSSRAARQSREDTWERFVNSLDNLDIDIAGSVRAAQDKIKQGFIPGTPGAPGRIPSTSIRAAEKSLKEAQNARRSAQRGLSRASREDVLGIQTRLDSANEAINVARQGLREAREGVSGRLASGRRIAGARREAEERLERFSIQEEPLTGGPTQTFDRVRTRFFVGEQGRNVDAQLKVISTPEYQTVRRDALDETNRRRGLDFPDYDNQTAVSAVMKAIFPFWGYESHRWAWWLPREALRHPGVWASWGKYVDNTDGGYLHIPGTSIDINLLRGTILMGGIRRLVNRDFPEYFDNFEGMAEIIDYGTRWGFYPGFPVGLIQAAFGASSGRQQLGELVPASAKTVFAAITAISPKKGKILNEIIFPDRFRDYLTALELSRLEFDIEGGLEGPEVLRKRMLNQPLNEEEQAAWDRAARGIAVWQVLFEQTGLFRFNPEERRVVRRLSAEILEEVTGMPAEQIEDLRRFGLQIEEIVGALSPDQSQALKVLDQWRRFTGASIALLPSQEGLVKASIAQFWNLVTDSADLEKETLLSVEQEFITNPTRGTMSAWLDALDEKVINTSQLVNKLRGRDEDGEVISENQWTRLPVTLQERRVAAEKTGLKVFYHALEEMRELYYQRSLDDKFDEDLGRTVKDYDAYYLHRQVIEDTLGEDAKSRLLQLTQRNDSPLEALYFNVTQEFLIPYNNIRGGIMQEFTEGERVTIRKAREAKFDDRQVLLREKRDESPAGEPIFIVAEFEKRVRTARENLRDVDPELDAWLVFFNRATNVRTTAARNLLSGIYLQLQLQGVQPLS